MKFKPLEWNVSSKRVKARAFGFDGQCYEVDKRGNKFICTIETICGNRCGIGASDSIEEALQIGQAEHEQHLAAAYEEFTDWVERE